MQREYTSTVYIVDKNKILLHPHPKIGKWLPPGGHIEENETPPEAAIREVYEETGLEIEFISQENVWVNTKDAYSIYRPFMCLVENLQLPKRHQHIDFIFLAKPKKAQLVKAPFEWLTFAEVLCLDNLFLDTKQAIEKIFYILNNESAYQIVDA